MSQLKRKLDQLGKRQSELKWRIISETEKTMCGYFNFKKVMSLRRSLTRIEKERFLLLVKLRGRTDAEYDTRGRAIRVHIPCEHVTSISITRGRG